MDDAAMPTTSPDDPADAAGRARLVQRAAAIREQWDARPPDLDELCRSVAVDAQLLDEPDVAIDMLRRLATLASEHDDDTAAFAHLDEAMALAAGRPFVTALLHRDIARLLPGSDAAHSEHLLAAAAKFEESDEPRPAALALLDAGEAQGASGNRTLALEHFEHAQVLAREAGDGLLSARADDRIAAAYWELGRSDLAERHLREALTILNASGDEALIAYGQYRLGWFLADHEPERCSEEALWLLARSREHGQESKDLSRVAACDEKASWVKAAIGERHEAISLLRTAVTVFTAVGDEYSAMVAECNLAAQLIGIERVDEGMARYRDIISRAAELGSGYLQATVSTRLADALAKRGLGAEALETLESVSSYFENDDNTVEATSHILATAAAHRALKNVRATHECAERALDRLDRALLPSVHARALEYIAECVLYDGDRPRAESLFGQAVALYLIDDEPEHARRVAQQILPDPPRQRTSSRLSSPQLSTGLYL